MIFQLVLEYFQLQLSDILLFLESFGLFWIVLPSKGLTAFLRQKNPKKASGLQKPQSIQASCPFSGKKKPEASKKTTCLQPSIEKTAKKVDSS